MTSYNDTSSNTALVAIDIAKAKNDIVIERPGSKHRQRLRICNTDADHQRLIAHLGGMDCPICIGFEATGNYHRPLAWRLLEAGFDLRLISCVALARTREALHNGWDKNDSKDAQVILHMLRLGDRELQLKYYGPNHGESLVVMRLPRENILFIVDIVTPRRVAFRSMPDFWPDEWIRSLREIEASDFDYVIPGHGPQTEPAIDPASVVMEQRVYLEDLMAAVGEAMKSGTHSPDALRETVKLPKYEEWRSYDEWLPMNIERIWAYYHMGW